MSLSHPRVSVVIPAYHSYDTLQDCLAALRAQTFRDFETILVNSSPEERTGEIAAAFPEVIFHQSPIRLLPHAARNRGVAMAHGELLVFTDPDCRADPEWLARIVAAYEAGNHVVGGSMGLIDDRWLECGVHLSKFSWLLVGAAAGPRAVLCTANAAYGRSAWDRVGPFDEDFFIGDAILSWRAAATGFQPWLEPSAVVDHRHEGNARRYWKEFLARGRELAEARISFENWSRQRAAAYLALLPLLPGLALTRIGRDAIGSTWAGRFVHTLPLQLLFRSAWALGEADVYLKFLRGRWRPRPVARVGSPDDAPTMRVPQLARDGGPS